MLDCHVPACSPALFNLPPGICPLDCLDPAMQKGEQREGGRTVLHQPPRLSSPGGPGTNSVPKSTVCVQALHSPCVDKTWTRPGRGLSFFEATCHHRIVLLPLRPAAGGHLCSLTGRCFRRSAAGEAKEEAREKFACMAGGKRRSRASTYTSALMDVPPQSHPEVQWKLWNI
jgi:hypothetical protein